MKLLTKLLSSLGETAEQFGETAGQTADDFGEILYFWHEINTFLIHKIIWAQMKTCYNLPVCGHQSEKNILVEGFLKNTYMNPLLKLGKT